MGGRQGPTTPDWWPLAAVVATSCVIICIACYAPELRNDDPSAAMHYVSCTDWFGGEIYEGPAINVRALVGGVFITEPSGLNVVVTNTQCVIINGTPEQLAQSMEDHGFSEDEGDTPSESF